MKFAPTYLFVHRIRPAVRGLLSALLLTALAISQPTFATSTSLADQPLFTYNSVPGNLLLSLSVEFPTAISVANSGVYVPATAYIGYFDNSKCYNYQYDSQIVPATGLPYGYYFMPVGSNNASDHSCSSASSLLWSGNFMNWAAMQTIDPFRFALTGGYRVYDTDKTVLEKAWASTQGSAGSNFPERGSYAAITAGNATPFTKALVGPIPVSFNSFGTRIWGIGNLMYFVASSKSSGSQSTLNSQVGAQLETGTATPWDGVTTPNLDTLYSVVVRVRVCVAGLLETDCNTTYSPSAKPEGLMQQYNQKIRYGAFGYLNDGDIKLDAGVLRAKMAFVGPTTPVINSVPVANPSNEWDATTGIYTLNPDPADATATNTYYGGCGGTCATNSGVLNYLNKFGETSHSYKTYDPVSELYYATVRYYRNWIKTPGDISTSTYPNVPSWTPVSSNNGTNYTWVDGFPVITAWDDPILYSCQKNFILGIGDIHTHDDGDLPGGAPLASNEPTMPALIASDPVNVQTLTNYVAQLENAETSTSTSAGDNNASCCTINQPLKYVGGDQNTYFMAGIAYGAHTSDIRPGEFAATDGTKATIQTVQTYWLDVLEARDYQWRNAFWLASKYGGFTVPANWVTSTTSTPLTKASWNANNRTDTSLGGSGRPLPDNYYDASHADTMVAGLASAFQSISSSLQAFTTSFSLSAPVVTLSNSVSYSAQYDSSVWQGDVIGQLVTGFDSTTGAPIFGASWDADVLASAMVPATRNIVTCCSTVTPLNPGIQFTASALQAGNAAEFNQLTSTSPSASASVVLDWLTGGHSNEVVNGGLLRTRIYTPKNGTPRSFVTGDIVDSAVVANGPPSALYNDAFDPGYSTYTATYANRTVAVFAGANDGMLHAYDGSTGTGTSGKELFDYIPSAMYHGPTSPTVDGLAALANPTFVHHYYVDQTPVVEDIDFSATTLAAGGSAGTAIGNWHSILIGGLGKGGKSYYALDVTNPASFTPSNVLWEFSDADLGYTFGPAVIVKTARYGWVAILTSGYDNNVGTGATGKGFFYIVNAATGVLLEKIPTNSGSVASPSGLGPAAAFVNDYTNGTADAAYAGDLNGDVWRIDLTTDSGAYAAATHFAALGQPITVRPLTEIVPGSDARRILVGTGELLSTNDISSVALQSFYSIVDGNSTKFSTTGTYPIIRSAMHGITYSELTSATGADPLATGMSVGYYLDLSASLLSNTGYRINVPMVEDQGVVLFAANRPVGDACNPTGTNAIFALDISTGGSEFSFPTNGTPPPFFNGLSNVATSVAIYGGASYNTTTNSGTGSSSNAQGGEQGYANNNSGSTLNIHIRTPGATGLQKLNWREVPSAN